MAEEDFNLWVSIIRSCCLTSKKPLTIHEIARDVKQLEDREVPYRSFKFRSLEEMIKSIPSLKVFNLGGMAVVQAVASEESAHITKMVQRQRTSKKKSRTMAPRAANRYNMSNRRPNYPRSGYNNRPNNFQNNYVPNRQTGQYSSQNQSSYNNRNQQQQQQNGEHYRRTNSSPATMQPAPSRQVSSPTTLKRVSFVLTPPPTPQMKSPPTLYKSPTAPQLKTQTTTSSFPTTPLQQRLAQVKTETPIQQKIQQPTQQRPSPTVAPQTPPVRPPQPSFTPSIPTSTSSNIQERLNVQKPRATVQPMHDPRLILNSYVEARNLPLPVYKDIPSTDKNIYSSVTVNSKKYSSYPGEAKTKDDAEKLAAQAALTELLDKSNMPQKVTTNNSLIMQRILDIVHSHTNGLFESSLVANYVAKYNEGLPSNWLKLVENTINIDIGANNLTILSPQHDSVAQQTRPIIPTISEPPALNVSNLDEFYIKIYVAYSTVDIWGVIIHEDNSDKIDDLANDMKCFYDINEATPAAVVPGQYYAVFDSAWHRVRCIKVDANAKTATVFFIDRGEEDVFELPKLRDLSVKFYNLPAQAIQISLVGLESFSKCDEMQEFLEDALLEENVNIYVKLDPIRQDGSPLPANCYFETDKDTIVDLNQDLIAKFMSEVANPKITMKSDIPGSRPYVYISEIRNKQIYIQVQSTGFKLLNEMMTNLAKTCLDVKPVKPAARLERFKLYLVKHDDQWKRIKLVKEFTDKAQVACVDDGSIIEVPKDCLVAIEDVSPILTDYPYQATQINLHKISPIMFDEKMATRLRSLAPKDDVFIMKVVGDFESIPMVELYKRTENNMLASLNDTLVLEAELSSKTDDNNNDKSKSRSNGRKSLNARTEFPLKTPTIPAIDEFFDVVVTMAAHPSNFTVQPLQTAAELTKLMSDLSAVCNAYHGPPLISSSVKVGSMYAAKYDNDGKWYRAYVSKILGKNICAVYFCDYGDYRAVSLEQLQPLANQFYDLPYQAIKAKLHGITPKLKGDWTVKDSLRFNELVVDKFFVSCVKKREVDNSVSGEIVLSLELIDTNTDDDVYITHELIKEKRAERIED